MLACKRWWRQEDLYPRDYLITLLRWIACQNYLSCALATCFGEGKLTSGQVGLIKEQLRGPLALTLA